MTNTGAKFLDDHTSSSRPRPPTERAISPQIAKNGNIPNIWSLDLRGASSSRTPTAPRASCPPSSCAIGGAGNRVLSYYKGENGIHIIEPTKAVATVASATSARRDRSSIFSALEPHGAQGQHPQEDRFEKMTMAGGAGQPGRTSGGTFYGNTELVFADVLGDKQISFFAQSGVAVPHDRAELSQHRAPDPVRAAGLLADLFYYGQNAGALYDPVLGPIINSDRQLAEAVQSTKGGSAFAIYPFNRYTRVELSADSCT